MIAVTGYPQPGKAKSLEILSAFCVGAGGVVAKPAPGYPLKPGAAAFYGTVGIEGLYALARQRAQRAGGDYYYLDNAYFDRGRNRYYRVSRNALQRAQAWPDFDRLDELRIEIRPWRSGGAHVVVVEQSDYFMRELGAGCGARQWREGVVRQLREHTDREIRVRAWTPHKLKAASTLAADLEGAWALVTHASAAAVEAVLAGVPAFVTGESVAAEMGQSNLAAIEAPWRPDWRLEWAAKLAGSQWTLDEMRAGAAWRALTEEIAV